MLITVLKHFRQDTLVLKIGSQMTAFLDSADHMASHLLQAQAGLALSGSSWANGACTSCTHTEQSNRLCLGGCAPRVSPDLIAAMLRAFSSSVAAMWQLYVKLAEGLTRHY